MLSPDQTPEDKAGRPSGRRTWLLVLLGGAGLLALVWLTRRVEPRTPSPADHVASPAPTRLAAAKSPGGSPRSTAGLNLDRAENILPDHRTAKEQKDEIVKQWGEFLQAEKTRLGAETFDPLAKRWLERPRLKALIEEWKSLEQAWPERSEQERDAQLPRIRAMWTEAMAEFAAELGAAGYPAPLPGPR